MMSNNRRDFESASAWLLALRQDESWLSQLQRLQAPADSSISVSRDEIMGQIGQGDTFQLWNIYQHKVEPVVTEVWGIAELSLVKLKIQTIGMLSMEWLETKGCQNRLTGKLASEEAMKYWKRLQAAGFVDGNYQLLQETTRKQAMYIAELFAERLGIKSKWKTFEQLWGINNLAQEKWDMLETGSSPLRSKEIEKIFKEERNLLIIRPNIPYIVPIVGPI